MTREAPFVSQYLEGISRGAVEKYHFLFKRYVRHRQGVYARLWVLARAARTLGERVQLSSSASSVSIQVLSGLYRFIAEAIFVVSGPRSF